MFQKLATPTSIFDGEMSLGRRRKFLRLKIHLRKMRSIVTNYLRLSLFLSKILEFGPEQSDVNLKFKCL